MEIQFEQNRDFNQSHREGNHQNEYKERLNPKGKEGDPHQYLVNREELDNDEKGLDRRPSDIEAGKGNNLGHDISSAIAGVQDDQQNSTRNSSKPLGEDPNHNAEIENKEDGEDSDGNE